MGFHRLNLVAAASILLALGCSLGTTADTESGDKPATTLHGGVVQVQTGLDDLRDARLSVSRVRKAVANLYDEVTRVEMSMMSNPNVIGTTIIMTPMPVMSNQPLPARPKWVKAAMDEIRPTITLFKEDVTLAVETDRNVDASDATKAQLDPLRQQAFANVDESFKLMQQLDKLTAGSSYDNAAIADASKELNNRMKDLDKTLRKGISILQKEAKAKKKNA